MKPLLSDLIKEKTKVAEPVRKPGVEICNDMFAFYAGKYGLPVMEHGEKWKTAYEKMASILIEMHKQITILELEKSYYEN